MSTQEEGKQKEKKKRVANVRINDTYKNYEVGSPLDRQEGDERLPMSLLTYEEFCEGRKIAERCQEKMKNWDKDEERSVSSRTGRKNPIKVSNPQHPSHELYNFLANVSQRLIGTKDEGRCIICGEILSTTGQKGAYPYCGYCGRRVAEGKLRGVDNTSGLKSWGKICVVCGKRPAHPNYAGMCKSCYRFGDKLPDRNVETIRAYYNKRFPPDGGASKIQLRKGTKIVEKNWKIGEKNK